mmetsp:Transcript_28742/g.43409  ORF Transcript_28742/g.43409 Transcript_28742/m.43409 type:complete len:81 (-) Transcript_28742:1304-1546(-)
MSFLFHLSFLSLLLLVLTLTPDHVPEIRSLVRHFVGRWGAARSFVLKQARLHRESEVSTPLVGPWRLPEIRLREGITVSD